MMQTRSTSLDARFAEELRHREEAILHAWLEERTGLPGLRLRSGLPVDPLRRWMPVVLQWVSSAVAAPSLDEAEVVEPLRALARVWRTEGYNVSEVLAEVALLDRRLFAVLEGLAPDEPAADPASLLGAAERLHDALSVVRVILAGTYEEETQRDAGEASERLETFVRTLSHEIKNPIGAAQSGAALLREKDVQNDAGEVERFAELVVRNLDRALALIADLRSLVLPGEDGADRTRSASLESLLRDVLLEIRPAAASLRVRIEVEPGLAPLELEARRGTLILMNLVWNAVKYSDPSKETRWVKIATEPLNGSSGWRIRVSDNGLGIAPEHQERIFERFYRAHREVDGGTGLGLPIAMEAARQLGASLTLESEPGVGTSFFLDLPAPGADASA